jgi:hypothetical protein
MNPVTRDSAVALDMIAVDRAMEGVLEGVLIASSFL